MLLSPKNYIKGKNMITVDCVSNGVGSGQWQILNADSEKSHVIDTKFYENQKIAEAAAEIFAKKLKLAFVPYQKEFVSIKKEAQSFVCFDDSDYSFRAGWTIVKASRRNIVIHQIVTMHIEELIEANQIAEKYAQENNFIFVQDFFGVQKEEVENSVGQQSIDTPVKDQGKNHEEKE
jgi:hypothetical protein